MKPLKFVTGLVEHKPITLKDVEQGQFFINNNGYLCQKLSQPGDYSVIATPQGTLHGTYVDGSPNTVIRSIRSEILSIEF